MSFSSSLPTHTDLCFSVYPAQECIEFTHLHSHMQSLNKLSHYASSSKEISHL